MEKIVKNLGGAPEFTEGTVTIYLQEDYDSVPLHERPVMVICPGGGYDHLSVREGDIIAMQFLAMGYQAAIVRYSCDDGARYPLQLIQLARAVAMLRQNRKEWHIAKDGVFLTGFSAGGHLACCFCTFWSEAFLAEAVGCSTEDLKPNGQILCYPVITAGEYSHAGSFKRLLGEEYEAKKDTISLELHVNDKIPRTFIWHTFEDQAVPVQNSLLYARALADHGIPVEYHLFEKGHHGVSLGNKLSSRENDKDVELTVCPWINLLHTWIGWFQ